MEQYNYQNSTYESGMIFDFFACGSAEKDEEGNKFSGAYPAGFLKRVKASFKEYYPKNREDILHVCSGRIPSEEGIRLDISEEYDPDILSNAEDMSELLDETFQWVMADTPYNKKASEKYYNVPMLNRSKVIKEMTRVCKVNGFISTLDQISANNVPRCLKRVALIGVTSIPNQDIRAYTVWRKIDKYKSTTSKKKK